MFVVNACVQKKAIGILQPVYLPWLGYFEQMACVDQFIFMDDVQYTRRDWRNRNRIKTASGSTWLTVPVRKHAREALINEIEINYAEDWVGRHLRTIEVSYKKCPHFQPLFDEIREVLGSRPARLSDLDCQLILLLSKYLDIQTPIAFSSEVPRRSEQCDEDLSISAAGPHFMKNQRIMDICEYFKAEILYDGAKAAEFIDLEGFRQAGIEVIFQDYQHPVYRQVFGEFVSHQSVIDLIMNAGADAPNILRSSPLPELLRNRMASDREQVLRESSLKQVG